jgi:hypothetical protein
MKISQDDLLQIIGALNVEKIMLQSQVRELINRNNELLTKLQGANVERGPREVIAEFSPREVTHENHN